MKKLFGILFIITCICCGCGKLTGTVEEVGEPPEIEDITTEVTTSTESATTVTTTATSTTSTETTTTTTEPLEPIVINNYDTLDVYSTVHISEFISETNAELSEPDLLIDTSELGAWEVPIKYTYGGEEHEDWLAYNVVDIVPPTVLNMGWNPYTKLGEPFNLNSVIGYADNFDKSPTASYTGTVDTSALGSYPISVTITDNSGNVTSFDMTVQVVEIIPEPADNNDRLEFSWFTDAYKTENTRIGIDVSEWQPNTNFVTLKEKGVEFVLMRIACYYSQIRKDNCFDYNIEAVTNAGLDKGIYYYSTDTTEEGVREHARWIIEQLNGRQLEFPIAFDWEEFENFQNYGLSLHDLNNLFEAFCDEVEKAEYTAMLYSSKNFLESVWENPNNRPVWLAHYTSITDYNGNFAIWQSSAYARTDGIEGDFDIDVQFVNVPLDY